jgi:hypothetical protein
MKRFNFKKCKEWNHVEISNRFSSLENLDTEADVTKAWETI